MYKYSYLLTYLERVIGSAGTAAGVKMAGLGRDRPGAAYRPTGETSPVQNTSVQLGRRQPRGQFSPQAGFTALF